MSLFNFGFLRLLSLEILWLLKVIKLNFGFLRLLSLETPQILETNRNKVPNTSTKCHQKLVGLKAGNPVFLIRNPLYKVKHFLTENEPF
jgi:hypothetical protein